MPGWRMSLPPSCTGLRARACGGEHAAEQHPQQSLGHYTHGFTLVRHEIRCFYLRPLPTEVGCFRLRPLYRVTEIGYTRFRLRERAALGVEQVRLGEGASSLDSNVETPSPSLVCRNAELPQGESAC